MSNISWIEKTINDVAAGKPFKRRIQSGIDHLEGKKLYKYYSFSSQYTVSNLKSGSIYLQNPIQFNDPFDCNIGISVDQLIKVFVPDFAEKVFPDGNEKERKIIQSWLLGESEYELKETSKTHLLSICANNPSIVNLIERAKMGGTISGQEATSLLIEHPHVVSEMLKAYLDIISEDKLDLDDNTIQQVMMSPQLVANMIMAFGEKSLFKENPALELLTSKEDFFAKIKSIASYVGVNLPEEQIENMYFTLDETIKEIRYRLGNKVGIECFTQSPTDVLMWSYYAEKHTGVCVEYDFSKMFTSLSDAFLLPVYYSEKRPLLNLKTLSDLMMDKRDTNKATLLSNVIWSWITKSSEWEREKEWRLIKFPITNDGERSVKLPIVSKIITGINISEENYRIASDIAGEKGIPIYKTRLKNDRYRIEIIDEAT